MERLRIAIIGMGLIGTSLGMALRSAEASEALPGELWIAGYDQDQRATSEARGRLAIDEVARSLEAAVQDAQVVLLAVPVQAIPAIFRELAPRLAADTIVTDTASTKAQVCAWARELLPAGVDFVGGHPMAGKEQSGPRAADGDLFREAIYCLTPDQSVRQQAVDITETLVRMIGAKPYYIDPDEHDVYVAGVSHLPFLLSSALVAITSRSPAWKEMAPLAASGFRDVTRLASGDPQMQRDICLTNRTALIRWLNETAALLLEMRDMLQAEEAAQLEALFEQTRQTRDAWLASKPHLRPGEEDCAHFPQVERPGLLDFLRPSRRKGKQE